MNLTQNGIFFFTIFQVEISSVGNNWLKILWSEKKIVLDKKILISGNKFSSRNSFLFFFTKSKVLVNMLECTQLLCIAKEASSFLPKSWMKLSYSTNKVLKLKHKTKALRRPHNCERVFCSSLTKTILMESKKYTSNIVERFGFVKMNQFDLRFFQCRINKINTSVATAGAFWKVNELWFWLPFLIQDKFSGNILILLRTRKKP